MLKSQLLQQRQRAVCASGPRGRTRHATQTRPSSLQTSSGDACRLLPPSDGGDIEAVTKLVDLPRTDPVGAQLSESTALIQRVREPLVHLPRHVAHSLPARTCVMNRPSPSLARRVIGRGADVVVQAERLERGTREIGQQESLAARAAKANDRALRQLGRWHFVAATGESPRLVRTLSANATSMELAA